jgi:hypothetical protein
LRDWQFTLGDYLGFAIVVLTVIATFVAFATFLQVRACRIQCAHLREQLRRLSEDVQHLVNAEQRRFLKELQSSKEDAPKPSESEPPP